MKYESELIKEIVDSRGHDKSSLHYESECGKTWIEEAKGAYPKLCDYEAEWLNYISILDDIGGSEKPEPPIEPDPEPPVEPEEPETPEPEEPEPPIGKFPYVALTDVTEATVHNVVPYAYKSAILKGQTLVNVVSDQGFGGNAMIYEARFIDSRFNTAETFTIFVFNPNITTIKVGLFESATSRWAREDQCIVNNNKRVVYTVPANYYCTYVGFQVNRANDATGFEISLVIVSGDKSILEIENYFDGMKTVKMPGLKTTNEDGTKTNILTVNEDVTLRSNGSVCDELDLLTGRLTQRIGENNEVLAQEVVKTVELTVVNQDGETMPKIKPIEGTMHLSTSSSSDAIPPLFSGEIPVEAITQNLASFIDLETGE